MKQGQVVLLADRHQNMLEGVRSLLEAMFDAVVMVADEQSLLESLDKLNPDLVVVDLSLPTKGGGNISRIITRHNPELKVIALSVHDEAVVVEDAIANGVKGFVLIRTASTDLIPAVTDVMQNNIYVSPEIIHAGKHQHQ
jgi:two-component system response regulator DegU